MKCGYWAKLQLLLAPDDRVVRQQFGSAKIKRSRSNGAPLEIGYDLKAAATDCLKKCATLIGVGLYLTRKDEAQAAPVATDRTSQSAQERPNGRPLRPPYPGSRRQGRPAVDTRSAGRLHQAGVPPGAVCLLPACSQPRRGSELMARLMSLGLQLCETVVHSTAMLDEIDAVLHVGLNASIWPLRL